MTGGLLQADMKAQNGNLVAANFKGLSKRLPYGYFEWTVKTRHNSRSNPSPRFLGLFAETKFPTEKKKVPDEFSHTLPNRLRIV